MLFQYISHDGFEGARETSSVKNSSFRPLRGNVPSTAKLSRNPAFCILAYQLEKTLLTSVAGGFFSRILILKRQKATRSTICNVIKVTLSKSVSEAKQ